MLVRARRDIQAAHKRDMQGLGLGTLRRLRSRDACASSFSGTSANRAVPHTVILAWLADITLQQIPIVLAQIFVVDRSQARFTTSWRFAGSTRCHSAAADATAFLGETSAPKIGDRQGGRSGKVEKRNRIYRFVLS